MAKHLLNPTQIKNLTSQGNKIKKYHDGEGLYLWVYDDSRKWWRFRYRFDGVNKPEMSLGAWPDVKITDAREKADELRSLLKQGIEPATNRKAQKTAKQQRDANSFELVAREWFALKKADAAEKTKKKILRWLENDVFPFIGQKPVSEISAPEILEVLRRVEKRCAVTSAHRIKGVCSYIFCYAVATSRATSDPTVSLKGALATHKVKHFPAIIDPVRVGELMRAMEGYKGTFFVRSALNLAPLVFVRPGELRQAEWKDFDLDSAEWRYQISKTEVDHIVPLSRQALIILKDMQQVTGGGKYVFPSATTKGRPMSANAILAALRRIDIPGEEMTGHGFRAMARTILEERLNYPIEIIEQQLSHTVKDSNGRAYNRTKHLDRRHEMMQSWADYLDQLKAVQA